MRFTRFLIKTFLAVAITAQFFLFTIEDARGQEPRPEPPKIIRKSGGVLQGSAVRRAEPAYPPLAKAAKVSGSVVVEVTVDEDGKVIAARAIAGHPLLKDSAVAAARNWKFTPTMLAGTPVKVIGTITFNYNLDEPSAQTDDTVGGVPSEIPSGVPGGVPGGILGGVPGGVPGVVSPRNRQQGRMTPSPAGLLVMLEQSGYRYSKVSEGIWEIDATGKNVKDFKIRVTMAEDLVLLIVKLADRKDLSVKNELLVKLLELNHHFDIARIALSDEMLYSRIDLHARIVDGAEFNYAVEQLAAATDEIYPALKPFIALMQTSPDTGAVPGAIRMASALPGPEPQPKARADAKADSEWLKLMGRNPAVDSKPVTLSYARPLYTEEARKNKVKGNVRVHILVGADGEVKDAVIIAGLPDGLDEEALAAAYKMKFKPAMKDGKPVDFWLRIDVGFHLQ
ncbi:MAG TPA: energy transducer TonB [Blastocatellia bacterium]|nr:energy transducer TonB [Blastocatellia bacterium]